MIGWRAATGAPRDDPDATGLTEPPDKNGDARDEDAADIARKGNPAPEHAAGLPAGDVVFHSPALDAPGLGMGHAGRPRPPGWRRSSGPFWGQQGFPDAFLDETLTIDTRRQRAVFTPWTAPATA